MKFDFVGDELLAMEDQSYFASYVKRFYMDFAQDCGIELEFDSQQLHRAHEFWLEEIDRFRRLLGGEPCEYKRSAALSYWLYRECPVAVWNAKNVNLNDLNDRNKHLFDYLLQSGREICAFKLGFETAKYYKIYQDRNAGVDRRYDHSEKFVNDIVYFMKRENFNMEGIYICFKSIFDRN